MSDIIVTPATVVVKGNIFQGTLLTDIIYHNAVVVDDRTATVDDNTITTFLVSKD
jgi:hypothetical protein